MSTALETAASAAVPGASPEITETETQSRLAGARGAMAASASFLVWGLAPAYWALLKNVNPVEVIVHRIVWSFALTAGLLLVCRRLGQISRLWRDRRTLCLLVLSAAMLAINWQTFIWLINRNQIIQTSLGYFINPLLSILLGAAFLSERLRRWQVLSLLLAVAAMINLVIAEGRLPWESLALAGSFAVYGLIRKVAKVDSLTGLLIETGILSIPALGYLTHLQMTTGQTALQAGPLAHVLLVGSGVLTALPLITFAYGARRISLSAIGFLQYLAPSCSFLLAVLGFHEKLSTPKIVSFDLIWLALGIYSCDSLRQFRRRTA